MAEVYDIFLSYRRDGGFATANHINDLLVRDGYTVTFDIDTLREGDFDKELLKRIDQCTDFILIVDRNAFDRTLDPKFDKNKDWLRMELAYALKLRKNVIPILLSGVNEFPTNLPTDISDVTTKNGPEYNKSYFDEFYKTLKEFLHCVPRNQKVNEDKATLTINSNKTVIVFADGEEVTKVNADGYAKIQLLLGKHFLKYQAVDNPSLSYSETITLSNKQNYVVEIRDWKFKTKKIPIWMIFTICIVLLCTLIGINYPKDDRNSEINTTIKEIEKSGPFSVTDTLVELLTLGELPYTYSGTIDENGLPHGKGIAKFSDKNGLIEGNFVHGVIEGEATQTFYNGDVFKGSFKNNKYEKGDYYWKEGEKYRGTYQNMKPYMGTYFNKVGEIEGVYDKGRFKATN